LGGTDKRYCKYKYVERRADCLYEEKNARSKMGQKTKGIGLVCQAIV